MKRRVVQSGGVVHKVKQTAVGHTAGSVNRRGFPVASAQQLGDSRLITNASAHAAAQLPHRPRR